MASIPVIIASGLALLASTACFYFCSIADWSRLPNIPPSLKTEPEQHFCRHCSLIWVDVPGIHIKSPNDTYIVRLPHTVQEVYNAALDGCPLFRDYAEGHRKCNDVLLHLQVFMSIFRSHSDIHAFTGCSGIRQRALYFFRSVSKRPFHIRFGMLDESLGKTLYARLLYSYWKSFELDISADWDDAASEFVEERPLSADISSNAFQRVRSWLAECCQSDSHADCRNLPEGSHAVPSRVIEVKQLANGTYKTCIRETKHMNRPQWASLSYCWGGDQLCKTTKANLSARKHDLPFSELSKTLQDALAVTIQVGLHHLWIDALCIIQDDPDDLQRELAAMPDIYTRSVLTIIASRAGTASNGFLEWHTIQFGLMINVNCAEKKGQICLTGRDAAYASSKEPIDTRAWCFQERILSVRILDFGSRQLRWSCRVTRDVDGGNKLHSSMNVGLLGKWHSEAPRSNVLAAQWRDTVSNYTRRELSFDSDKLLAISAIASRFNDIHPDQYLAGMWKRSLLSEIGWRAGRPRYHRPASYVGPSWSWVSIRDGVFWGKDEEDSSLSIAIEVLDSHTTLQHSNKFGSVTSGHLELRGQYRPARWVPRTSEVSITSKFGRWIFTRQREDLEAMPGHTRTHFLGWISPDALGDVTAEEEDKGIDVVCLKICHRTQTIGTRCLLLVPAASRGGYRRIAFFEMGDALYRYDPPIATEFFGDVGSETIRIV